MSMPTWVGEMTLQYITHLSSEDSDNTLAVRIYTKEVGNSKTPRDTVFSQPMLSLSYCVQSHSSTTLRKEKSTHVCMSLPIHAVLTQLRED